MTAAELRAGRPEPESFREANPTTAKEFPPRWAKRWGGTVRVTYGDGTASPRRWLHSGDGVLAQGAAGLVLGYAIWPSEIEFEWANGEKHSIPVRPETHDYVVP